MALTVESVASRFCYGAQYATQCAAIFRLQTSRFHLHFLVKLGRGVLPGLAMNCAVRGDAIDHELVFSGARTVDLQTAFKTNNVSELILPRDDRWRSDQHSLEAAGLRQPVKFFGCDVVGDQRALRVDEGNIFSNLYRLGYASDHHLGIHLERLPNQDDHV